MDKIILLILSLIVISCGKKVIVPHDFPMFHTSDLTYLPYVDEFVADCKKYLDSAKCEQAYNTPINVLEDEKFFELTNSSSLAICITYGNKSEIFISKSAATHRNESQMRNLIYHELGHSMPFNFEHRDEVVGFHNILFAKSIMHPFADQGADIAWDSYVKELFTNQSDLELELQEHFTELVRIGRTQNYLQGSGIFFTRDELSIDTNEGKIKYFFHYDEELAKFDDEVYFEVFDNVQGLVSDGVINYSDLAFDHTSKYIETPHITWANGTRNVAAYSEHENHDCFKKYEQ